jgi:GNAT superfamily N-acetyltransferase
MTVISATEHADLDRFCSLKGYTDLSPDLVRQHAPNAVLMTSHDGQLQGRASLWWGHLPEYTGERLGFIGHYAVRDGGSAAGILAESCRALAAQGCTLAVGPIDGSTWRHYRLITQRGPVPPFFLEPDNPDDWPGHFESAGFHAFARYYSSLNEDNARCKDRSDVMNELESAGYALRPLTTRDVETDLSRLWRLSSEAFRDNFLYTPITEMEFHGIYAPLLTRIRPELVLIIEKGAIPVAFCLAVPDLLQAGRGHPVDTLIVKSIAVRESHRGKGLAAMLLSRVNRTARALGMHRTIHALMHEDNPSRRLDHDLMRDFRRYTLYARPL